MSNKKPSVHLHSEQGSCVQDDSCAFALEVTVLQSLKSQGGLCVLFYRKRGKLTEVIEVAVGSPFCAVPTFQSARL